MGIPIILVGLLICIGCAHITSSYYSNENKKKIKKFLETIDCDKILPHKVLDEIEYLKFDFKIKMKSKNKDIMDKYEVLKTLASSNMCNLGNISNDEIKARYGINNFQDVITFQTNYENFLIELADLSEMLIQEDRKKDDEVAMQLLELGITLGTDITKNYTLLADIYNEYRLRKKLFALVDYVKSNTKLSQQKIMKHIINLNKDIENGGN